MTDPIDIVVAARRQLVSLSSVTALCGPPPGLTGPGSTYDSWIFQWRPYVSIVGTGSSLIVVSVRPGGTPATFNTWRYPTLQFEIQSDADRGSDLNPTTATGADQRAYKLFQTLDPYFHAVEGTPFFWGQTDTDAPLRIVECSRQGEPAPQPLPNGDGASMLVVRYSIVL